ncbi:MAG: DUF1801 domain-containing protein [Candidatus Pristimantibacillus lignocellulolyticus]|uniref:DUF1801 domain-containing protein n=1 Tax=Candidatus Pristimantibacillus lignocellulolyticus TaxID=2994561 RepID=A0A9J6ZG35_9BACL|nr:MAG: DUF1801 domain-containing protein [Candidatus Pristimantibacillus lignocellulolyticus]
MAYEQKMKQTDHSVIEFIENIESISKKEDAYRLLDIFSEVTGYEAKLWGPSIIGFGVYQYTYPTGHSGTAPLVGFSPRKAKISLYLTTEETVRNELLPKLGKHSSGKSCVYINKVADIQLEVLQQLIKETVDFVQKTYPQS